ncbi:hypothetical protein CAOG_05054 [Capsaspora owczarzaki ATCC 30864]|uniref:Rab-GAP TBC domain-containing protein n=1 Tax=Capsaspora owczarzaki (strain ATCC 30864) TaxID=595528 RepID=A0A0D2UH18_CAPO3|nr:hypothetical protein CAOG_05054 [Capsaspora owczarzaki ATCC 30864]KJE94411.1 hypothetical protein CAOG_005054 [Capsaspora owczarzaki ATCC 30864]|eukprot:XP_004346739.1 hypothetical protein CAOG_05054 [Capsaspora owczarzaki ATCC 30864]
MYASAEDFQEVLGQESYVDMDRLKDLAVHGIPDEVRADVWRYLLRVAQPDKSQEVTSTLARSQEYSEQRRRDQLDLSASDAIPVKRVRGEIKRFQDGVEFFQQQSTQRLFENVVSVFLSRNSDLADFTGSVVPLCGPVIFAFEDNEAEAFHAFSQLMRQVQPRLPPPATNKLVADLMAVFRATQSELYSHFEQEELEPNEWAVPWLQSLLAKELPLSCVVRLWDTYLAQDDGFALHPYVCLAILAYCKETIEELEYADLLAYLQHLPEMDMDRIIAHAHNIWHEVISQNLM